MPTSCQLRVVQYARTISHDSPAPHSYHPTMGRRQRRQPIIFRYYHHYYYHSHYAGDKINNHNIDDNDNNLFGWGRQAR